MPLFAETPRLTLRALEKSDLPRIVELIGDWDVTRWLVAVPYPYSLRDAEDYYERMTAALQKGVPEYFVIQHKGIGEPVGALGLHPSREPNPLPGERVIGYWLGKNYWGQGLMSEALEAMISWAFAHDNIAVLTSTTDPANDASQNVLRKAGLTYLGISPRHDPIALRGGTDVTRWQMTRADYEKKAVLA